jgi:hypothetical protein
LQIYSQPQPFALQELEVLVLDNKYLTTIKNILNMHQLSMEGIEALAKEIEQLKKEKDNG